MTGPQQNLPAEQLELHSILVEGAEPDAYIVIRVRDLSTQILLSATAVGKRHRGDVRPGEFEMHLMRSLMQAGALVNTKYLRDEEPTR